jgi:hypothetical protein
MDQQQKAIIQLQCQQLLNRVTLLTDDEQWLELSNCYTEDAELFRPSDSSNSIKGRNNILASFQERPPRTSCHMLANTYCNVISANKVIAKSRVWLITGEASDTFPVKANSKLMIGSFTDTLVRVDDEWLIKIRKGGIELKYSYQ